MGSTARHRVVSVAIGLLVVVALAGGPGAPAASAGAENPCLRPGNLVRNCSFDGFAAQDVGGRQVLLPDGWSAFVLSGTPDYRPAVDTCPGRGPGCGAPSLWLLSDGLPFTAGVYQQIAVTPGVVYQADAGWAATNAEDVERKLGLDPSGGTDPLAPSVVWGPAEWSRDVGWPDLTVTARATGPTMTLFVWVCHPTSHGTDSVYLDAPGVWPDLSQPAATATPLPSPTATRRPKTSTPTAKLPTSTPTTTPSPTPTSTATPTATTAATATPTATWTATASPVPPTATATRVAVVVAGDRLRSVPVARVARHGMVVPADKVLLGVAASAVAGALLLVGSAGVLWRRGRRGREPEPDPS